MHARCIVPLDKEKCANYNSECVLGWLETAVLLDKDEVYIEAQCAMFEARKSNIALLASRLAFRY